MFTYMYIYIYIEREREIGCRGGAASAGSMRTRAEPTHLERNRSKSPLSTALPASTPMGLRQDDATGTLMGT